MSARAFVHQENKKRARGYFMHFSKNIDREREREEKENKREREREREKKKEQ